MIKVFIGIKWEEKIILWYWEWFYSKEWYETKIFEITAEEKQTLIDWWIFDVVNWELIIN